MLHALHLFKSLQASKLLGCHTVLFALSTFLVCGLFSVGFVLVMGGVLVLFIYLFITCLTIELIIFFGFRVIEVSEFACC